jgi:peptidoglycan/LPS O-acetylase OafA/YrhL
LEQGFASKETSVQRSVPEILPLTALRGWLAWWVVLFHLTPLQGELFPALDPLAPIWHSGDVAVDVFFVLSGFVIGVAYHERLSRGNWATAGRFLWARLCRVYPVHFVHQLLWMALVFGAIALGKPGFGAFEPSAFVRSFLLIQAWEVPMQMYWNYPAWSISMEWVAYLSTPPLLTGAPRLARAIVGRLGAPSRQVLGLACCLALWLCLLVSAGAPWGHFVRIGCEYSAGLVLSALHRHGSVPSRPLRWGWLALLGYVVATIALSSAKQSPYWAAPLAGFALLGLANATTRDWFLGSRWSVYQGRISYSIYMSHALTITVLHQALHPSHFVSASWPVRCGVTLVYLAGMLAGGALTYHLVEEPGRHWLQSWLPSAPRAVSAEAEGPTKASV